MEPELAPVSMTEPIALGRAEGVILGAAVGDALGWPQELRGGLVGGQRARDALQAQPSFLAWTRSSGHYTSRRPDPVLAGEYSDDTQLLCSTARACLAGADWSKRLSEVELPAWPVYQRGGGGAVLSAAASWAEERPPWVEKGARSRKSVDRYRRAGANGVAMRIAPHVLFEDDLEQILDRVLTDGLLTHGHPRALVGALVYAASLRTALRPTGTLAYGELLESAQLGLVPATRATRLLPADWADDAELEVFARTWEQANDEVRAMLAQVKTSLDQGTLSKPEQTLTALGCSDPKVNGAGTVTAVAAIYLASRYAARPLGGLLTAAFVRKGDTDTLASMTAALLGAVHQTAWLGELADRVQDAAYLRRLAAQLAGHDFESPPRWPTEPVSTLRARLLTQFKDQAASVANQLPMGAAARGASEFPDGRRWELLSTEQLPRSEQFRARLQLDGGQTVLLDLPKPVIRQGSHKEASDHAGGSVRTPEGGRFVEERTSPGPLRTVQPEQSRGSRSERPAAGLTEGVLLSSSQVSRCAAFYAQLLSRQVPVREGRALIANWLVLQAAESPSTDTSLLLRFAVDDLRAAGSLFGRSSVEGLRALRGRDPDGRMVEVFLR